tara:strand:- start:4031 stop:4279 length:249 start_codon:yes stop_codon:yes gene_type:complete
MKTIHYGNTYDTSAKYRPIAMYPYLYDKVREACEGHYGMGGQNENAFYVNVSDWKKAIEIVNDGIESGLISVFTLRTTKIKL